MKYVLRCICCLLIIEPGSQLHENPTLFNIELYRSSFKNFLNFTNNCFNANISCFEQRLYSKKLGHPYGYKIFGRNLNYINSNLKKIQGREIKHG